VDIQSGNNPEIMGDRGKLQRLLHNLISNALRYADSQVSVTAEEDESGWVKIRVEDNGNGIPEAEREKIFQRYYRVDASRNRSSGGSGLGLAICNEIVRAHGGSIHAGVSGFLGGAELTVLLPGSE
jgi:two-component system sensor histidine kinase BaeS